jgi:acyl-CoA synthetase (AMP-forming)/AMP-acid ligase II
MSELSFADVWEQVADAFPDATAQIHGDRRYTWREFDRRADGVAQALLDAGLTHQDKVAQYLYNCPEYMESVFGATKVGGVPVNTNYRYTDDELVYLWDNADAVAVVFHAAFVETIERIRDRVPRVKLWLCVDDGTAPCPEWATPYEEVASSASGRVGAKRGADDIYMLYTGGTTGMPKGVMWRQSDLINMYARTADPDASWELPAMPGGVGLSACPLMHGTGAFVAFIMLNGAGSLVTLTKRNFDVAELLDTIEREKVNVMAIVGDSFAKPMLRELDANPGRWNISSLLAMISSGVMWSHETKQGLLKHHPGMILNDAFSSSEALGMGSSVSSGENASETAKFTLGPNTRVISEDGKDIVPGSGDVGMVAVKGLVPVGYYKDPEKSAATFRMIDGDRYSVPGDFATVEADGTLKILGRGSVCINTGGEKVFPEEVEEVIKRYESVFDCAVVGVPDEKWGEAITAIVQPRPGAEVDETELVKHVKSNLAAYKAPKHVIMVDTIGRSPAGKVDYPGLKQKAIAEVG